MHTLVIAISITTSKEHLLQNFRKASTVHNTRDCQKHKKNLENVDTQPWFAWKFNSCNSIGQVPISTQTKVDN